VTAAELIERLRLLPPDTVIGISGPDALVYHISRTALAVVHPAGVAIIDASPRGVITEEDLS
jgi:hypothetical protein